MESKLKDPKNWTTRRQIQALDELPMRLYYWQDVSCMHDNGNCTCKHKNDFGDSKVATVADWLESSDPEYDGHLEQMRTDFEQRHYNATTEESQVQGATEYSQSEMPQEALLDNKASIFVVRDVRQAPNFSDSKVPVMERKLKNCTKIIRYVKKTLRELQESWGYDIHIENIQSAVVKHQTASMIEDVHIVFWFRKN